MAILLDQPAAQAPACAAAATAAAAAAAQQRPPRRSQRRAVTAAQVNAVHVLIEHMLVAGAPYATIEAALGELGRAVLDRLRQENPAFFAEYEARLSGGP